MERVTRRQKDYWRKDFLSPVEESGTITSHRKDFNPFENKTNRKKDIFIVDWQVCDEEHLD